MLEGGSIGVSNAKIGSGDRVEDVRDFGRGRHMPVGPEDVHRATVARGGVAVACRLRVARIH